MYQIQRELPPINYMGTVNYELGNIVVTLCRRDDQKILTGFTMVVNEKIHLEGNIKSQYIHL